MEVLLSAFRSGSFLGINNFVDLFKQVFGDDGLMLAIIEIALMVDLADVVGVLENSTDGSISEFIPTLDFIPA